MANTQGNPKDREIKDLIQEVQRGVENDEIGGGSVEKRRGLIDRLEAIRSASESPELAIETRTGIIQLIGFLEGTKGGSLTSQKEVGKKIKELKEAAATNFRASIERVLEPTAKQPERTTKEERPSGGRRRKEISPKARRAKEDRRKISRLRTILPPAYDDALDNVEELVHVELDGIEDAVARKKVKTARDSARQLLERITDEQLAALKQVPANKRTAELEPLQRDLEETLSMIGTRLKTVDEEKAGKIEAALQAIHPVVEQPQAETEPEPEVAREDPYTRTIERLRAMASKEFDGTLNTLAIILETREYQEGIMNNEQWRQLQAARNTVIQAVGRIQEAELETIESLTQREQEERLRPIQENLEAALGKARQRLAPTLAEIAQRARYEPGWVIDLRRVLSETAPKTEIAIRQKPEEAAAARASITKTYLDALRIRTPDLGRPLAAILEIDDTLMEPEQSTALRTIKRTLQAALGAIEESDLQAIAKGSAKDRQAAIVRIKEELEPALAEAREALKTDEILTGVGIKGEDIERLKKAGIDIEEKEPDIDEIEKKDTERENLLNRGLPHARDIFSRVLAILGIPIKAMADRQKGFVVMEMQRVLQQALRNVTMEDLQAVVEGPEAKRKTALERIREELMPTLERIQTEFQREAIPDAMQSNALVHYREEMGRGGIQVVTNAEANFRHQFTEVIRALPAESETRQAVNLIIRLQPDAEMSEQLGAAQSEVVRNIKSEDDLISAWRSIMQPEKMADDAARRASLITFTNRIGRFIFSALSNTHPELFEGTVYGIEIGLREKATQAVQTALMLPVGPLFNLRGVIERIQGLTPPVTLSQSSVAQTLLGHVQAGRTFEEAIVLTWTERPSPEVVENTDPAVLQSIQDMAQTISNILVAELGPTHRQLFSGTRLERQIGLGAGPQRNALTPGTERPREVRAPGAAPLRRPNFAELEAAATSRVDRLENNNQIQVQPGEIPLIGSIAPGVEANIRVARGGILAIREGGGQSINVSVEDNERQSVYFQNYTSTARNCSITTEQNDIKTIRTYADYRRSCPIASELPGSLHDLPLTHIDAIRPENGMRTLESQESDRRPILVHTVFGGSTITLKERAHVHIMEVMEAMQGAGPVTIIMETGARLSFSNPSAIRNCQIIRRSDSCYLENEEEIRRNNVVRGGSEYGSPVRLERNRSNLGSERYRRNINTGENLFVESIPETAHFQVSAGGTLMIGEVDPDRPSGLYAQLKEITVKVSDRERQAVFVPNNLEGVCMVQFENETNAISYTEYCEAVQRNKRTGRDIVDANGVRQIKGGDTQTPYVRTGEIAPGSRIEIAAESCVLFDKILGVIQRLKPGARKTITIRRGARVRFENPDHVRNCDFILEPEAVLENREAIHGVHGNNVPPAQNAAPAPRVPTIINGRLVPDTINAYETAIIEPLQENQSRLGTINVSAEGTLVVNSRDRLDIIVNEVRRQAIFAREDSLIRITYQGRSMSYPEYRDLWNDDLYTQRDVINGRLVLTESGKTLRGINDADIVIREGVNKVTMVDVQNDLGIVYLPRELIPTAGPDSEFHRSEMAPEDWNNPSIIMADWPFRNVVKPNEVTRIHSIEALQSLGRVRSGQNILLQWEGGSDQSISIEAGGRLGVMDDGSGTGRLTLTVPDVLEQRVFIGGNYHPYHYRIVVAGDPNEYNYNEYTERVRQEQARVAAEATPDDPSGHQPPPTPPPTRPSVAVLGDLPHLSRDQGQSMLGRSPVLSPDEVEASLAAANPGTSLEPSSADLAAAMNVLSDPAKYGLDEPRPSRAPLDEGDTPLFSRSGQPKIEPIFVVSRHEDLPEGGIFKAGESWNKPNRIKLSGLKAPKPRT